MADGMELKPFQRVGAGAVALFPHMILADEMGCIDGSAIISVHRAGATRKITLEKLYRGFNGLASWDTSIPAYCKSLIDGELRLNQIMAVLDKGTRPVLKITLASGKTLRLTPDHDIATTPDKGWIQAQHLYEGAKVLTNGVLACSSCGSQKEVASYKYAKFRGICRTCIYRKHRLNRKFKGGKRVDSDGYVRVSGQFDHPRAFNGGMVFEHILVMEKSLGRRVLRSETIHHKNEDKSDNRIENLQLVSVSEHNRLHKRHLNMHGGVGGKGGTVTFIPAIDEVVSVCEDGTAKVYDLVMNDPGRNFVANGVIVHNCGKTCTTIAGMKKLKELGRLGTVLVVCPSAILYQWEGEVHRWFPGEFKTLVIDNGKSARYNLYDTVASLKGHPYKAYDIVFMTYAIMRLDSIKLSEIGFSMMVFDEASALKNPDSEQSTEAYNLSLNIPRVLLITATPVQSRLEEYHALMKLIDPEVLGNKYQFENRYCHVQQFEIRHPKNPNRKIKIRNITGYKNLEIFKEKVGDYILQRSIEDVGAQLPELIIMDRQLTLNKVQRTKYDELSEGILSLNGVDEHQEAVQQLIRMSQVCDATQLVYPDEDSSCKIDELKSLLKNELRGEQIVVFSKYVQMLEIIRTKVLEPMNITYGTIYGGQGSKTEENRVKFQDGKIDVILMSPAGEMGLNLGAGKYLICVDTLYNEGRMRQLYARIRRMSSVHPQAIIIRFICKDTLEEKILKLLDKRGALIDYLDSPDSITPEQMTELLTVVNSEVNLLD